jgi:receptor-type tyrosine-protein phosphatase F
MFSHIIRVFKKSRFSLQTEDQYIFIHDALLEAAVCGNTEVPARSLHQHLEALLQTDVGESSTGMEAEFKVMAPLFCALILSTNQLTHRNCKRSGPTQLAL